MAKRRGRFEGSIYQYTDPQRGQRWCGAVDAGRGPDGRRRRMKVYGKTRAEVADRIAKLVLDQRNGIPLAVERLSVGEFLDRWLRERVKPTTRPRTYQSYEHLFEAHIAPALGGLPLKKLHAAHIQAFLNAKLEAQLSPRTVGYMRAVLRAALNHAVRLDLVPRNVATRTTAPKGARFEVRPLTPDQARTLLQSTEDHRLHALILLTVCTGLRQGEALGLTWDDLSLERSQITVRHTLQLNREDGTFSLAEPKTDRSRRTLTLPPLAVEALRQHRVHQQTERLALGRAWRNTLNLVFTSEAGTPLESCNVTHALKRMLKAAHLTVTGSS